MDNSLWVKMHGGTTHFPIALAMASVLFDSAGYFVPDSADKSRRAGLYAAGFYSLILAAFGSLGAVLSGLVIAHWQLWGVGNLGRHHACLWPAFSLLIGLAAWRLAVRDRVSRRAFKVYLAASLITAGLCGAAGYWGGEMLLNG